jgi:hypothetical protein
MPLCRRSQGRDVVPFDLVWEGWAHAGTLPQEGVLRLGVACLRERESSWLTNARLGCNAGRLMHGA